MGATRVCIMYNDLLLYLTPLPFMRKRYLFITFATLLVAIYYGLKEHNINYNSPINVKECIYSSTPNNKTINSMGQTFQVNYVENSSKSCINPHFPSIHINTKAKHNAWIHIVFTDSKEPKLQHFIDSPNPKIHPEVYPFYTLEQDFFDAPYWNYSFFLKPITFWKGHVYAVNFDKESKIIKVVGGIEWGFRFSHFHLYPQILELKALEIDYLQNDRRVFEANIGRDFKLVFAQDLNREVAEFQANFPIGDIEDIDYVKLIIDRMYQLDQKVRMSFIDDFDKPDQQETLARMDNFHTAKMKEILSIHKWLNISKFGKDYDHKAWLLVQHADDLFFKAGCLFVISKLVDQNETDRKNYAYLYDRVALKFQDLGLKQKYGTQVSITETGKIELLPYEGSLKDVEKRRQEIGLEPLDQYTAMLRKVYANDHH